MEPFYCLILTPEAMTPELWVLAADNQRDAIRELGAVKRKWPRLERLEFYQGEQRLRTFRGADLEQDDPPTAARPEPISATM